MTQDPQNRPLSPHLTIYRPQLNSVLSIMHRITGIVLFVGLVLLILWFFSLALGQAGFELFGMWMVVTFLVHFFRAGWIVFKKITL